MTLYFIEFLYSIQYIFNKLPAKRSIKTLAEVPVSNGGEYLGKCFIVEAINRDDIQVTGEAA